GRRGDLCRIIKCHGPFSTGPHRTQRGVYHYGVPTTLVSWGLSGTLVIALVVALLVARAARQRESATAKLLTTLQADIRNAAAAEGWPLKLDPLPSSPSGVGDLVVWDLQATTPSVMT